MQNEFWTWKGLIRTLRRLLPYPPRWLPEDKNPKCRPPKPLITKNLCTLEILKFMKCMTTYEIGIICGKQHEAFKLCKTQRNSIIFEEIKKWEKSKFSDFQLHERKEHMDTLQSTL